MKGKNAFIQVGGLGGVQEKGISGRAVGASCDDYVIDVQQDRGSSHDA